MAVFFLFFSYVTKQTALIMANFLQAQSTNEMSVEFEAVESPELFSDFKAFFEKQVKPDFMKMRNWEHQVSSNYAKVGFVPGIFSTPLMQEGIFRKNAMVFVLDAVLSRVVMFKKCVADEKVPLPLKVDYVNRTAINMANPSMDHLKEEWDIVKKNSKSAISFASVYVRNLVVQCMKEKIKKEKSEAVAHASKKKKRATKERFEKILRSHTGSFKKVMAYALKLAEANRNVAAEQKQSRDQRAVVRAVKRASVLALV